MAMLKTFVSLAEMALLIQLAMAANYNVGAPNGSWDLTTPLQAWANSQTFFPGDTLTFAYTANHDVNEVSKPDYDACLANNSIQTFTGSNTVITLTSSGNRYFVCGTPSHCNLGMKVAITTLAPSPATPPVPLTPAAPSGSPTASPASSPVSSPSPKAAAPVKSPTEAPKVSPSASPSKSPIRSPSKSPRISPISSPTASGTESSATPPFPSSSSPSTTPSSASKILVVAGLKMGLGLIITMLLVQ